MYILRNPFNSTLLTIAGLLALLTLQPFTRLVSNIVQAANSLPLSFVSNVGQADQAVQFQVRSLGGTLFFTRGEVVLSLPESAEEQRVLRMRFEGANPELAIRASELLPGVVNYFLGNDPAKWQTNIPTYGGVVYESLYPGIDLAYDGSEGLLKGTYTVAAGADPSVIRWRYMGAERADLDTATGDLRIGLLNGNVLSERAPTAWQEINGVRMPVAARFTVADDGGVGIALGRYDAEYALTIDPVLVYSTYLGGTFDDDALDLGVDSSGNIYLVGKTASTDYPVVNPVQGSNAGDYDVYVTKLNPTGTALVYSTYIGGTAHDKPTDLVIDAANNAYVSGLTAGGFPTAGTPNSFQSISGGQIDGFAFKLNSIGNSLIYSTFLGGSSDDTANDLAVDEEGNAYITGQACSSNFPLHNPIYGTNQNCDAYVLKLNPSGSALVYSTYLGGSGLESGSAIGVDSAGNAYLIGNTPSTDFPMAGTPYQSVNAGGYDLFLAKFNSTGTALVYSTYLGGGDGTGTTIPANDDEAVDIVLDESGNSYVVGYTRADNFPLLNPYQSTRAGDYDLVIAKLNSNGSALTYSTYLGGNAGDFASTLVLDAANNVYIVGSTFSTNFPTLDGLQTNHGGTTDVFVSQLNSSGSGLLFSTILGGEAFDNGRGIAVSISGTIYISGESNSTNFPTIHPLQASNSGGTDAFVAMISPSFIVNTPDDTIVGTCDAAHCSLREAINAANTSPGPDAITFNIPGAGSHTIQVGLGGLPVVTDPVVIDGTTQPGYAGAPVIVVDGSVAGEQFISGLMITGGNSTVRGLVINNFTFAGIFLSGSSDNVVEGNFIGTDATGTQARGNRDGVYILDSANNRIGGTAMGMRNIISGNTDDGINLEGSGATGNQIHNNYIGTTTTGYDALGNAQDGIKISGTSSNNLIGWTMLNIIAYNGMRGVYVEAGTTATGNAIRSNTITLNGGLGIDLGGDGVTQNDTGDGDSGSNNLQNSPTITAAVATVMSTRITGHLNSIPNTTHYIEFFVNEACDTSGFGEGESRLGGVTVATDATGNTPFIFDFLAGLNVGYKITATATNLATNDTSEFSACATVRPPGADLSVTQTDSPEAGPPQTPVTYTITVSNNGPDTATGVTLTDDLPDEVNFTSATPSQGNCSQALGIVTCNLGDLANGATATVTVVASLPFRPTAVNQVTVNSGMPDPNPANNSDTETTIVIATPTPTYTPSRTYTPSDTPTPLTATPTVTNTRSSAPPAFVPFPSLTPSDTPVPSNTALPSATPTVTNTAYLLPTATATHTPLPPPPPIG